MDIINITSEDIAASIILQNILVDGQSKHFSLLMSLVVLTSDLLIKSFELFERDDCGSVDLLFPNYGARARRQNIHQPLSGDKTKRGEKSVMSRQVNISGFVGVGWMIISVPDILWLVAGVGQAGCWLGVIPVS